MGLKHVPFYLLWWRKIDSDHIIYIFFRNSTENGNKKETDWKCYQLFTKKVYAIVLVLFSKCTAFILCPSGLPTTENAVQHLPHPFICTLMPQPSGAIWGSVSCPRTPQNADRRRQGANRPPDQWTSWATAAVVLTSQCKPPWLPEVQFDIWSGKEEPHGVS